MQAATNNKSNSLLNSAGVTKEEKKPGMFASETKKRKFPILWAACILLFFCPGYFENVPWATGALQVLAAGRYVVSGVAIVAMVMRQHDRPLVWLLALYQVCVVVSGMLLGDINLTYALSCLTFIGLIAINIELYKQYQMSLINCYYWILLILLLGNAVTQIIFPSGLIPGLSGDRRIWLLGPKNSVTLIYILFSCCAFLRISCKNIRTRITADEVRLSIVTISLLVVPSSTALASAILVIFYFIWIKAKKQYLIPVRTFLLILALFFCGTVVLGTNDAINSLIAGLFGKTGSFSGRQAVWEMAMGMIGSNPLGSGLDVSLNPWGDKSLVVYSAHNTVLDIAVRVGVISAAVFCIAFVAVCLRCKKGSKGAIAVSFLLFAGVASMMEANQSDYALWVLFSLCIALCSSEDGRGTNGL